MATPLINPLRVQGGTFYTFSSAVADIQKTFTDDDARFVFSKFVLLDIPDVATPTGNYENFIVWEAIGAYAGGNISGVTPPLSPDNNINLAQSFQNYVLNFEEEILQGTNTLAQAYDPTSLFTTSERLFWRWMAQINAIRFRNATAAESTINNRYTEEDPNQYYKRVVKYIGDIDVVNNVSYDGHAYSEVYMNVPTQHGSTPLIMWKSYQDANYGPGRIWTNSNTYISGRDSGSIHPSGLSMIASYDDLLTKSYQTYTTFGDVTNWQGFAAFPSQAGKPVLLSFMDGAILDFETSNYKPIVNDPSISSFTQFNSTDASSDFTFNAALIYYDSYSASNSANTATNLYGVLILDDYVNVGSGQSYLKRFDKFKPNKITKLNGNGYSLKLDIKFDASVANAGVETLINDYNTFSMDLFVDASTRMQEAAEMFLNTQIEIINLKSRISTLENTAFSQGSLDLLAQRVSELETSLNNAKLAFASSTSLLDLINVNADNINQILSGNLSVNLTYNTDVLQQGDGVLLDRSVPNQVTVQNRNQGFNNFPVCSNQYALDNTKRTLVLTAGNGLSPTDPTNLYANNILSLGKFSNYFRQLSESHVTVDPSSGIDIMQDNLIINIQDNPIFWKKGQTYRIVFANEIDLNGFTIYIKTDATNRFGLGSYGVTIGTVTPMDVNSSKPIIDIVCTDENLYKFNIDIIR